MFKICCMFDLNYDDHTESINTYLEKTFPTVKAAEYYARRRMKSKKYKDAFTMLRCFKGAKYMKEVCVVVDENGNNVNNHYWEHGEGLA